MPKVGTTSIAGKPETLVLVVMTNEVGVAVQLLRQSQAKTARGMMTVQGVAVMVYVWERYLSLVRAESNRAALARMLLEPELKVAKERTALLLESLSSSPSALLESALNLERESDGKSLRPHSREGRIKARECPLSVRSKSMPFWNFAGVSKYLAVSSPRPPTCNISHHRRDHMDYCWGPSGQPPVRLLM